MSFARVYSFGLTDAISFSRTLLGSVRGAPTESEQHPDRLHGLLNTTPLERLVVEHVTRMHDDLAPDWPRSDGGYEVIVEGVPRMVCRLDMEDEHGDHAVGGVVLTATRIVNAIPAVVAAPAKPLSALDLPLITGRGLLAE